MVRDLHKLTYFGNFGPFLTCKSVSRSRTFNVLCSYKKGKFVQFRNALVGLHCFCTVCIHHLIFCHLSSFEKKDSCDKLNSVIFSIETSYRLVVSVNVTCRRWIFLEQNCTVSCVLLRLKMNIFSRNDKHSQKYWLYTRCLNDVKTVLLCFLQRSLHPPKY